LTAKADDLNQRARPQGIVSTVSASPTKLSGPRKLFGRDPDLERLDDAWLGHQITVVTIVAWGGVGKTALVNEWRNRLREREGGPERVFDWSFDSQGVRERGTVSADNFLREALRFFGAVEYAESNASPLEKGTRLAAIVGEQQALLILDGLEPLQAPPQGAGAGCALREGSVANLLRCLAAHNRGLCVVTTREPVHDLEGFESTTVRRLNLAHLSEEAGAELLASLLSEGERPRPVVSTRAELTEISVAVEGHALTLQLLGVYIRHALGDVRRWREIDFARANEEQGGHAFRVMAAYVTWLSGAGIRGQRQLAVLRLFGFFDRPADPGCIAALLEAPAITGVTEALVGLDAQGWMSLTSSLGQMRLVTQSDYEAPQLSGYDAATAQQAGELGRPLREPKEQRPRDFGPQAQVLNAHPLVREFFARELQRMSEEGWREGHRRLYEHLCQSVPYWPEEVSGLQPLYQAVVHGCAAGRIEQTCSKVYRARILRGARFYSTRQLGILSADLAAVACFFQRTWDQASPELGEAAQAWVLGEAAVRLHALGRLREALGSMRPGLEMIVKLEDWKNAAIAAGNLSALELTLGQTTAAVEDAGQSVKHADRSQDDFQRMVKRTTLANARHQAGDHAGAHELFEQAEVMQAQLDPTKPWLYSRRGYYYCDLLLYPAERAAWRAALGEPIYEREFATRCNEVFARASRALAWMLKHRLLLDIAMDHLTLGRAAFYAAILHAQTPASTTREPELSFATARTHVDAAVDGLREAGQLDDLPRGLITRAWLHHRERPDLARADLNEAWILAERGPMPLFQADIQLTRARLFHDHSALAHARNLIIRHGYDRRLEELTDTEHAALNWPAPALQSSSAPNQRSPRIKPMSTPPWDPTQCPDIAILIALPEEFRSLAATTPTSGTLSAILITPGATSSSSVQADIAAPLRSCRAWAPRLPAKSACDCSPCTLPQSSISASRADSRKMICASETSSCRAKSTRTTRQARLRGSAGIVAAPTIARAPAYSPRSRNSSSQPRSSTHVG
jgi:tetratricopeptide (TPR) repeat protein